MSRALLPILVLAALAGCAHTELAPFVPKTPLLEGIDARLLRRCPPLPENVVVKTEEDLLKQIGAGAELYATCAQRQDDLSGTIESIKLRGLPAAPAQ